MAARDWGKSRTSPMLHQWPCAKILAVACCNCFSRLELLCSDGVQTLTHNMRCLHCHECVAFSASFICYLLALSETGIVPLTYLPPISREAVAIAFRLVSYSNLLHVFTQCFPLCTLPLDSYLCSVIWLRTHGKALSLFPWWLYSNN